MLAEVLHAGALNTVCTRATVFVVFEVGVRGIAEDFC